MKPAPFDYHRPATLEEALALLGRYEGDAKVLAGGQSLIPLLNMRLARPAALIDLERIDGLRGLHFEGSRLHVGAMTRHADVERSADVRERIGIFSDAMPHVGHMAIRSRGTFGGSLAHADPAAELPALATLFDATFTIVGPSGAREVPWSEFFVTFLTSCLEADEILTGVTLTLPPRAAGWSFREIARRHGDFALAGCAAVVELEAGGTAIANARVALFGVDATPVRLLDAEPQLAGLAPGDPAIDDIAADAAAKLEPNADIHGSSEFRRDIARSLIASGIRDARASCGRARMSDEKHPVAFTLNGTRVERTVEGRLLLSDFLRHDLEFTGTHVGCEHGVCGSCTVLVDGEPARSCLMLAVQADGRTIETVESLAPNAATLSPLQSAFRKHHALQCGYCTPGFLMTATALLRAGKPLTHREIREALSGNLCRCTGYSGIVEAVYEIANGESEAHAV